MKTRAAVLWDINQDFEVVELDLAEPRLGEVLIRYVAAGFCHSDDLLRTGDIMPRFPLVGGHEGAGVIEAVGPGVTRVAVGDHVLTSFIPACGYCRWCSTGRQNLCDDGATILEGRMPDGTFRFSANGQDIGAYCMIGTFAERAVVSERSLIKVDKSLPLDKIVPTACGVPTGWGAAVYVADVEPGETVVVYGIGGLGSAAVQGALHAGATNLVAVDPLENKRQYAKDLGATHTAATAEEAHAIVQELTHGVGRAVRRASQVSGGSGAAERVRRVAPTRRGTGSPVGGRSRTASRQGPGRSGASARGRRGSGARGARRRANVAALSSRGLDARQAVGAQGRGVRPADAPP